MIAMFRTSWRADRGPAGSTEVGVSICKAVAVAAIAVVVTAGIETAGIAVGMIGGITGGVTVLMGSAEIPSRGVVCKERTRAGCVTTHHSFGWSFVSRDPDTEGVRRVSGDPAWGVAPGIAIFQRVKRRLPHPLGPAR